MPFSSHSGCWYTYSKVYISVKRLMWEREFCVLLQNKICEIIDWDRCSDTVFQLCAAEHRMLKPKELFKSEIRPWEYDRKSLWQDYQTSKTNTITQSIPHVPICRNKNQQQQWWVRLQVIIPVKKSEGWRSRKNMDCTAGDCAPNNNNNHFHYHYYYNPITIVPFAELQRHWKESV